MGKPKRRTLCAIKRPDLRLCDTMRRAVDDNKLRVLDLCSRDTGEPTRQLLVLRVGEFRSKGIALTFCPFCGGRLLEEAVEARTDT